MSRLHIGILYGYHWGSLLGIVIVVIAGGLLYWKYGSIWFLRWRGSFTWLMLTLAVPALGASLLLGWALALFGGPDGIRVTTTVDSYEIALTHRRDPDPDFMISTLEMIVIREDGAYYSAALAERDMRHDDERWVCTTLSIHQRAQRIYFLCDDEPISGNTPYVDTQNKMLYIGWEQASGERSLDGLPFYEPLDN
jgi:hypothetical protein